MTNVRLHKVAKTLRKLPLYVVDKLNIWVKSVEKFGLGEVRKIPGYHDEPLKGDRQGQCSIRLSKPYRATYIEEKEGLVEIIIVQEMDKHEY